MLLFSSDFHFGHEKILTLGKGRPFPSIDIMADTIIANINAVAGPYDTLYMLGDWCCGVGPNKVNVMRATRGRLNVGTVHLILGNHDMRLDVMREAAASIGLASVNEMLTIRTGVRSGGRAKEIHLCHFPLEDWAFESAGTWMLHGHRHGNGKRHPSRLRLDIGVDGHGYKPWTLDEVRLEMETAGPWSEVSHHNE